MPWKDPEFILFDPRIRASFDVNNLSFDHDGRFCFTHGNRVQCTRKNVSLFTNIDFTLATKDQVEVTSCMFWRNLEGCDRAFVVVGTEKQIDRSASIQIWNTEHGLGRKVFEFEFNELSMMGGSSIEFAACFTQLKTRIGSPPLLVGLSSGQVIMMIGKEYGTEFRVVLTLTGLTNPVVCIAADVCDTSYAAAADEVGNLVVWHVEMISEDSYGYKITYEFNSTIDPITCIGIRDGIVITGHQSGILRFHTVKKKYVYADIITNSKAIMCIAVHPLRDWVAVGGEDCRMACIEFARDDEHESVLLLSVCINGAIIGIEFTRPNEILPCLAIMVFELPYIIYYDYESYSGTISNPLVKPRSKLVGEALKQRRQRIGDRAKLTMAEVDEMIQKTQPATIDDSESTAPVADRRLMFDEDVEPVPEDDRPISAEEAEQRRFQELRRMYQGQ
uniref:Cilia- and flagella-associated protein 43 n=1 Tax=Compsopogon caeruleus TaxID=31354 RepID=A0A7S1XFY7_9RHOD|mmetsp:Transcript_7769/g.15672  ORF Transcript_7769/g.15672 Transcript_7769/m.15672 type:complete len:447 (+) Transcript_7769:183-1523(+)|eukprot:CAMPEP_0184683972 /NCGR_PEP_ID=MMETSP0312-20130426/13384_1 /TAXON_ID=31354 /ORGANISM="Compsopogon coeruleus, Strain SAG 36.94" /LENGTH=446 /DNA_ID=CAMNT_0027136737 /DNA_START=181 /DNA_END=1521 /DNA_ORIENTATION=+